MSLSLLSYFAVEVSLCLPALIARCRESFVCFTLAICLSVTIHLGPTLMVGQQNYKKLSLCSNAYIFLSEEKTLIRTLPSVDLMLAFNLYFNVFNNSIRGVTFYRGLLI